MSGGRDSGEESEPLPPGWAWAKLEEVAEVRLGRQRSPDKHTGLHSRPYLRAANVTWHGLDLSDVNVMDFTSEEAKTYELRAGDVLLNEASGSASEVGKAAIYRGEIDGCCFQNTLLRVRSGASLHPDFICLRLRHDAREGRFIEHGRGIGINHIGSAKMQSWPIALPPLPEQRRIVAKLDDLLSRSRRAREALAEVPALLERYRQSVLAAAFRGDLTADWREKNPEVEPASELLTRIRAERRQRWEEAELAKLTAKGKTPTDDKWKAKYEEPSPLEDSSHSSLPCAWIWVRAADLTREITVGHVGPMKDAYQAEGIPFLRSQNVRESGVSRAGLCFISTAFHNALPKSMLSPGDVVVVRTGAPGVSAVVPADMPVANCADLVIARPHQLCSSRYLSHFINSPIARAQVFDAQVGVAQQHFNVGSMFNLSVPITKLPEQHEIVRRIEAAFAKIDAVAKIVDEQLAALDAYDRATLTKAFRGELVPQDPSDEPASVMLDRIRAERASATTGSARRSPRGGRKARGG